MDNEAALLYEEELQEEDLLTVTIEGRTDLCADGHPPRAEAMAEYAKTAALEGFADMIAQELSGIISASKGKPLTPTQVAEFRYLRHKALLLARADLKLYCLYLKGAIINLHKRIVSDAMTSFKKPAKAAAVRRPRVEAAAAAAAQREEDMVEAMVVESARVVQLRKSVERQKLKERASMEQGQIIVDDEDDDPTNMTY